MSSPVPAPGTPSTLWDAKYDAENRQTIFISRHTSVGPVNKQTNYYYDGDGRRIRKVSGSQITVFAYDAFGKLLGEYSTEDTDDPDGIQYRTGDHLGSTRLFTNESGGVVRRQDYLAFGANYLVSSGDPRTGITGYLSGDSESIRQLFTGKERDAESGLDFFGARYYSASLGRFTSADAPFADQIPEDPQSWNLYSYIRNNPMRLVDRTGLAAECPDGGASCGEASTTERAVQGAAAGTGAQLANDGVRRGQYQRAASELQGEGASAARETLKAQTRSRMSPIGMAVTNMAKANRANQLVGKTAEQLTSGATRTSGLYNAAGKAAKAAGPVGVAVGIGIAANNVASAEPGERARVATGEAGALAGGLAGSLAVGVGGAKLGAAIGTVFGPGHGNLIGAAVGAVGGAIVGGVVGSIYGEKAATALFDGVSKE